MDNSGKWTSLQNKLVDVMGKTYSGNLKRYEDDRITRYKELTGFSGFDEKEWFDKAINTKVRGLKDSQDGLLSSITIFKDLYNWKESDNYKASKWFKFQEAVKEHEKFALTVLKPIFQKMGVSIESS